MREKIWGVIVGDWIYKTNITLQRASEIVTSLHGELHDVAIIPTRRRKA